MNNDLLTLIYHLCVEAQVVLVSSRYKWFKYVKCKAQQRLHDTASNSDPQLDLCTLFLRTLLFMQTC